MSNQLTSPSNGTFRVHFGLSGRALISLFMAFIMLLVTLSGCRPKPQIIHSLGDSTLPVNVLWVKQEIFTETSKENKRAIYAMPIARDTLRAINPSDGTEIWSSSLPLERGGGARGLITTENTVLVATSIFVDAYEETTGKLRWSTKLGDGHVAVILQLDTNIVRVYYGNSLIEVDSKTGKILTTTPKDNTVWMSGNVVMQTSTTKQLVALDRKSGTVLWTNDRLFYVDEGQEPLDIGDGKLLVGFVKGICLLDLRIGKYSWCQPEIEISNVAIDSQSQRGFALRDNLVLETIDLQTGKVLGETTFLSSQPVKKELGSLSSITFGNGVVVASFSDSGQTFGLQFEESR